MSNYVMRLLNGLEKESESVKSVKKIKNNILLYKKILENFDEIKINKILFLLIKYYTYNRKCQISKKIMYFLFFNKKIE